MGPGRIFLLSLAAKGQGAQDMEIATDVLVIGGGNAAQFAAITARRRGVDVVLLEAANEFMRGGNSRHTRDIRFMHTTRNRYGTGLYSFDEFWDDLMGVTGGETNEDLAALTIRASEDLPGWMESNGVRFQEPLHGTLHLGRTNMFMLGGGRAMVNSYFATARALGVRIFYEAEAEDLEIVDGAFRSATFVKGGERFTVSAKAVVVAAGGFEANLDWLRQYWGDAVDNFVVRGSPYNTGKMLRALFACGAQSVGDPKQFHSVALDARAPKFDGGIVTRLDSVPFGIVVNRDGQRFYDEGEDFWPKRYAIWGRLIAVQPDQIAYSIVDSKVLTAFMPSVFPPLEAGSLTELATRLELDPAAVQETVQRFNAAVRPGSFDPAALDDCVTEGISPPKTHWAQQIDTPPFYAYPLRPGVTFTYMGVAVDEKARVLMQGGDPFGNVFAAGEVMAGNILTRGYLAGFGLTIGAVFGRIAGEEAASWVGQRS